MIIIKISNGHLVLFYWSKIPCGQAYVFPFGDLQLMARLVNLFLENVNFGQTSVPKKSASRWWPRLLSGLHPSPSDEMFLKFRSRFRKFFFVLAYGVLKLFYLF